MRAIIAGCGFLGEAAADLFYARGDRVLGLCATDESASRLGGKGYAVEAMDISESPHFSDEWKGADLLVHCASSGKGGVDAYRRVYRDGLRALLRAAVPRRVVFVGSTSVYAQSDGVWVDETSSAEPTVETGRVLLEAEQVALVEGGIVLRLAGLYGPGRSVLLRRYLEGKAQIDGDGLRWINQIHRDDAAAAIEMASRLAPGIYNVVDDTPAMQKVVYEWIAAACGGKLPPAGDGSQPRKRGNTNKRVANHKLKKAGWSPQFPSYREALPGLLAT